MNGPFDEKGMTKAQLPSKDGEAETLVVDVEPRDMPVNLTFRMTCKIGYTNDEVMISFHSGAVHQLRTI